MPASPGWILILDDDARRRAEMQRVLQDWLDLRRIQWFTTAPALIDWLSRQSPLSVELLSLDHDLEDLERVDFRTPQSDPGTGREVVDYLVDWVQPGQTLKVLVHTTNQMARAGMVAALKEARIPVKVVSPYGDLDWISEAWLPVFRGMLTPSG